MRLVDADALKAKSFGKRGGLIHTSDIDAMPTVDAVPVVHGRWIPCNSKYGHDEKVYLCNQCNHNVGFKKMNFCPNCGAKMDGKGNGNETD